MGGQSNGMMHVSACDVPTVRNFLIHRTTIVKKTAPCRSLLLPTSRQYPSTSRALLSISPSLITYSINSSKDKRCLPEPTSFEAVTRIQAEVSERGMRVASRTAAEV